MTLSMAHRFIARLGVDGKQLIHQRDDARRVVLISGVELDGLDTRLVS
jgi:hypothetical protein